MRRSHPPSYLLTQKKPPANCEQVGWMSLTAQKILEKSSAHEPK
jgi:hypothetical protein